MLFYCRGCKLQTTPLLEPQFEYVNLQSPPTPAGMLYTLGCNHPKGQSRWDDSIPRDGGWLPRWDEALDNHIGFVFLTLVGEGQAPPSEKNKVNAIHPKPHPMLKPTSIPSNKVVVIASEALLMPF